MSSQWQNLDINLDPLAEHAETIKSLLDPAITFLDTAVSIIEAAAAIVAATNSILQATLNEIAELLKSIIGDILYANVSACAHHNVKWDDDWSWAPKKKLAPAGATNYPDAEVTNRNYLVNGDLPWRANGLNGWLEDVKASAYNGNNVSAPKTDSDDALTAFILVLIFPDLSAFTGMPRAVKKFLESLNLNFITDTWDRMNTEYGKSTARLKSAFDDELEYKIEPFDKGIITETNGEVPIWTGISLARIFGPSAENVFLQIDRIVDALKGYSDLSGIVLMLEGLAKKVKKLQDIIEELDKLIEDLVDMLLAISEFASWIVIKSDSGGMDGVIREALNASDYPTQGSGAAVAGICAVMTDPSTGDSIADKFDKLLQIFGLSPNQEGSTFINNLEDATSAVVTSSGAFTMSESSP